MSKPQALEVREVSKLYGRVRALDDVTLAVAPGERRALVGPNGAGKTTLFNVVAGTTRPSSGRVVHESRDITRVPEQRRVRLGIARTFQRSSVYEQLRVVDNLVLALQSTAGLGSSPVARGRRSEELSRRAVELLDSVNLARRASLPAATLSHGEKRQLEILMALALEPTLLLLDEPFAGMSPDERRRFVEVLNGLPRSITVLVIEHDIDSVFAVVSRVSVLDAGRIVAEGAPAEILASDAVDFVRPPRQVARAAVDT